MNDLRLIDAIGRLERAVTTLETRISTAPPPPADAIASDDGEAALRGRFLALEARHEALRERTGAAVERLSQLLDTAEPDPAEPDATQTDPVGEA